MKLLVHITMFLLALVVCQAQTIESPKYEFSYYSTINTHVLEEYECKLYFDTNSSIFLWTKTGDDEVKSNADGNLSRAEHLKNGEFNYTNLSENSLVSKGVVSFDEFQFVKQTIPEINWEITSLKKNIAGYDCTMAEGVYGDRKYIAWFTESIPSIFGPWKLQGLPGLILEAFDEAKEITFSLIGIKNATKSVSVDFDSEKCISLEEFYQRQIDYPFEYVQKIMSKSEKGSSLKITNINYNFIEKNFESMGKEEFKK